MPETISFVVVGYSYKKKAGKEPVYKVSLRNENGHSLTLCSSSKTIWSGYPIDSEVRVRLENAQKTLDGGPGE